MSNLSDTLNTLIIADVMELSCFLSLSATCKYFRRVLIGHIGDLYPVRTINLGGYYAPKYLENVPIDWTKDTFDERPFKWVEISGRVMPPHYKPYEPIASTLGLGSPTKAVLFRYEGEIPESVTKIEVRYSYFGDYDFGPQITELTVKSAWFLTRSNRIHDPDETQIVDFPITPELFPNLCMLEMDCERFDIDVIEKLNNLVTLKLTGTIYQTLRIRNLPQLKRLEVSLYSKGGYDVLIGKLPRLEHLVVGWKFNKYVNFSNFPMLRTFTATYRFTQRINLSNAKHLEHVIIGRSTHPKEFILPDQFISRECEEGVCWSA